MTQAFHFKWIGMAFFGLILTANTLFAQGQAVYIPLLESGTNSFTRIQTNKIDLIQISSALVKVANETVESMTEDKDQIAQTKMAIAMIIPATIARFNPILDTLKKNEVNEVYVVGINDKPEISSFYLAIPVKDKTDEQIKSLRAMIPVLQKMDINIKFPFVRNDFLFALIVNPEMTNNDAIKDYIKTRFKTLEPAPNPDIENVIEARPEATISGILTIDDNVRNQLNETKETLENAANIQENNSNEIPSNSLILQFILDNWDAVVNNLENYVYYGDVSTAGNYYVEYIVKMNSTENAQTVLDLFSQFNDNVVSKISEDELNSQQKELLNSLILTLQPSSNESSLIWRFDSSFIKKIKPLIIDYIKMAQEQIQNQEETQE